MHTDVRSLPAWLAEAQVPEAPLTPAQRALLEHAFHFRQRCGSDYYSTRLLSHFLLHCTAGLKVAHIARLLGISRSTAVAQQGLSSKEVVQAAHHRLAGRSHGKLLPRFAGPVAQFLVEHPEATRYDLLDFIDQTWGVRVTRVALHRFLTKYGLLGVGTADAAPRTGSAPPPADPAVAPAAPPPPNDGRLPAAALSAATLPVPLPPRNFFSLPRTTPAPSCCCPPPSSGSPRPTAASPMSTAR
jgi:hypothetical protein